ncbi:hypothetical protein ABIB25_003937 [Nakamurella sp. UYEF19]|uniref:hypothetical protein n=1 Tax=Nakamurella sp. UYEF19 TaxID=1756392 RepID=UPI00339A0FD1
MKRLIGSGNSGLRRKLAIGALGLALSAGTVLAAPAASAGPAISSTTAANLASTAAAVSFGVFRMADPQVVNGYAKVVYYLRNVPRGAGVQLQRTFGTANAWGTVGNVAATNNVGLTAIFKTPPIGTFYARLVVRIGARVLAVSPAVLFHVYSAITAEAVYGHTSSTTTIGSNLFRYIDVYGNGSGVSLSQNYSTCRSVTVIAGKSATSQTQPGQIQVVQEDADAATLNVAADRTATKRVALTGHAYQINIVDPGGDDSYTYLYAYFSCFTANGQ